LSSQLSDVVVDVSDTIPDVTDLNAVYIEFHKLDKTVFQLKETVRKQQVCINELYSYANNKNSSGDEIANVNFLRRYGTYVLKNTKKENLLRLTN